MMRAMEEELRRRFQAAHAKWRRSPNPKSHATMLTAFNAWGDALRAQNGNSEVKRIDDHE
jgi:hypothetical protein